MPVKKTSRSGAGDKRREAIMKAAWKLFMKRGYTAVSLDEIIRNAGGSKSSIYGFFGSKEKLFVAIIEEATANILKDMALPNTEGMPIRKALRHIGLVIGRGILSEKCVTLYRLSVSVSREFPKLARLFYESGPRTPLRVFAGFLQKQSEAGSLRINNYVRASEIFFSILLEYNHMAMSLNCKTAPSDKELEGIVDEAVDIFLRIYGNTNPSVYRV